jgi:GTP cyclohydrolase I
MAKLPVSIKAPEKLALSDASSSLEAAETERGRTPDLPLAARAIEEFLRAIGFPPESDPELAETGMRVARAYSDDLLAGYRMDPGEILRDRMPAPSTNLVVVTRIETAIVCPHHLLPATGEVSIGYLPGKYIVGLGALVRLVDCFSRRLSFQETMTLHIADALVEHLQALGAGCVASLSPCCLTARSERRCRARVVTVATAGLLKTDPNLRAEFLRSAGAEQP